MKEQREMKERRASKPLTRKQYMKRFSRSARWRMGAAEAAEAINDYQEMVYQPERDEARLVEELGDPVQAAWLLTDAQEFKRWRRVFAVLVCCALFIAEWAYYGLPIYWRIFHPYLPDLWMEFVQAIFPLAVGLILSVTWFRREGGRAAPVPKTLLLALAAVEVAGAGMLFQVWRCFDLTWVIWTGDGSGTRTAELASVIVWTIDVGVLSALAGAVGVLLARLYDRRWAALFILGVAVSVMCVMSQWIMLAMDSEAGAAAMAAARTELFLWLVPVGLAGEIGMGAALR